MPQMGFAGSAAFEPAVLYCVGIRWRGKRRKGVQDVVVDYS